MLIEGFFFKWFGLENRLRLGRESSSCFVILKTPKNDTNLGAYSSQREKGLPKSACFAPICTTPPAELLPPRASKRLTARFWASHAGLHTTM